MVWKLAFPSPVLMQKVNRFLMLTKEGDTTAPAATTHCATCAAPAPG